MSYDPKCRELAEHFLPEDCPEVEVLAQKLQDFIEDTFANWKSGEINTVNDEVDDDYCSHCGLTNCECPPLPKCYDCGGSGMTIEGFTCEVCEGIGELDL